MGDRVSIQFVETDAYWKPKNAEDRSDRSVALFHHWGGFAFVKKAEKYIKELNNEQGKEKPGISTPMTRREPNRLIVDFIGWLEAQGMLSDSIYLGKDETCGDNSDNGNWLIDAHTGEINRG